ncbi:MAG TPA: hypothetical protein VEW45_07070 [Candidatus Dormibacteraeota bacterium]|nr:hypothetical protein [Candidatus Dormibacteraeota bacterium]
MRRSLPAATVVVVGLLLLLDYVVINPTLAALADLLLELLVLLAAGAALAGGVALVLRHWTEMVGRRADPLGSVVLLVGFAAILIAGLYPGSSGSTDPAVRWLVAALLAPLIASLFAMLFFFLLGAARRGLALRRRESSLMLAAAGVVVVLLLPIGGVPGDWLATAASWTLAVPIGGVFRGLLIGVAVVTAVHATRVLLAVNGADE